MSVPSGTKFIGISPNVDTLERKSAQANSPSQIYTIEDLASSVTLQAVIDNNHDLVDGNNYQGTNAAAGNTGSSVNALGLSAARGNEGSSVNALGEKAAQGNTGSSVNALGEKAANGNTGTYINALGESAAQGNQGSHVNAFGLSAAQGNEGSSVNAFGLEAAKGNTGSNVVAIGQNAGFENVLDNSFIVANTEMPSYLNYAAANAAISGSGTPGNTYLYHDQTTNSIGAVRL